MLRSILPLALCCALMIGCRPRADADSHGDTSRIEAGTPRASARDTIAADTLPPTPSTHDSTTTESGGNIRVETPKPNQKI
ncbi:MAG: hypothetical protein ABIR47_15230, partial [Candidatus Kapaibacterium sp.]